jgi:hypothetical protein
MTALSWDNTGEKTYETGVDHGVLYIPDGGGAYTDGVAWNGLTTVTESPAGAEANDTYADNIKYISLRSAETFGGTIEAVTYPDEFAPFDGLGVPSPGVVIGQQNRGVFGLSYRTQKGNDVAGTDYGYKIHLIYGASASPSEKAYSTINDSPEPITFSWEISTVPVAVTGFKPTSSLVVDSTVVDPDALAALEDLLYGGPGDDPQLPSPDAVIALFEGTITVTGLLTAPAYNSGTDTITIPTTTGVQYYINGVLQAAGAVVITEDTIVEARPAVGYAFPEASDTDWAYDYIP